MATIRHDVGHLEGAGAQFIAGHIQVNAGVITLTTLSTPEYFTGDITAYRLGAGRYQVNVTNFRGPQSRVIPFCTVGSSSVSAGGAGGGISMVPMSSSITAGSYITATDTYGFVIGVASGSTFTEAECYFQAWAF